MAAIGLVVVVRKKGAKPTVAPPDSYAAPSVVTPFSALQLLRRMHGDDTLRLPEQARTELSETITRVESFYFAASRDHESSAPDLPQIVHEWLGRLKARKAVA